MQGNPNGLLGLLDILHCLYSSNDISQRLEVGVTLLIDRVNGKVHATVENLDVLFCRCHDVLSSNGAEAPGG